MGFTYKCGQRFGEFNAYIYMRDEDTKIALSRNINMGLKDSIDYWGLSDDKEIISLTVICPRTETSDPGDSTEKTSSGKDLCIKDPLSIQANPTNAVASSRFLF
ncbi:hypothetical protein ETB97_009536 [Aspergillus alliaceus]|uniref:Uncharacterized protein n=1 Tax=Petromyces alliaceus TaxID=209559 RepID=A0A8H6E0X9_PETAA|nr:hypothetical protein ETB97_009536 [Aspergillus burnettii]